MSASDRISARDYEIVGLNYEERWKRLDESVQALRSLWTGDGFTGRFYSTEGVNLEPKPLQKPAPPIWIGSWGSDAGLRRVARLGDGWLASAYNTMPDQFRIGLINFQSERRPPAKIPRFSRTRSSQCSCTSRKTNPTLSVSCLKPSRRSCIVRIDQIRERLLIGRTGEACAEKLAAYKKAGVQRLFVWPIRG